MDEAYLNQLRSRLDPSFHSQPPLPEQSDLTVTPPPQDEEEPASPHSNDSTMPAEDSTIGD